MGEDAIRRQLRYRTLDAFRIVYETGSATRTAERLGMTQPAVSQAIATFEQAFGTALFVRGSGRPLVPTPTAEAVYPAVRRALAAMAEIETLAQDARRVGQRRLRVGVVPALDGAYVQGLASRLVLEDPPVEILSRLLPPRELEQAIADGEIDLGLSLVPAVHEAVDSTLLVTLDAVAVVAESHRLARLTAIRPRDLGDTVVIAVRGGPVGRARIEAAFASDGAGPPVLIEATLDELLACVEASGGIALLAPGDEAADRAGIVVRPFRPVLSIAVRLLTRRGARTSSTARAFAKAARSKPVAGTAPDDDEAAPVAMRAGVR